MNYASILAYVNPTAMTWAQRLKRAFNIDIHTCAICGGAVKIIACIDDPVTINKMLSHLNQIVL